MKTTNMEYKLDDNKDAENHNIGGWIIGKDLLALTEGKAKLKRRYCFNVLKKYIDDGLTNYICALYGLRRTGKTVLMYQMIHDLLQAHGMNAAAYIIFGRNTDYTDEKLVNEIDELRLKGIKYVFIDEISYIKMNMEDNCLNILADKYVALGMKIVITGTFSYAIKLLEDEVLFDRLEKIDTTYFSFKEAQDVFGYDIEKFIQYGGVIKGESELRYTPEQYMQTAVTKNISSALVKSEKIYDIDANFRPDDNLLQEQKKIEVLIKRLIDCYMMQILYGKVVKSNYKYKDVGRLVNNIRNKSIYDSVVMELGEIISLDEAEYYRLLDELWSTLTKEDLDERVFGDVLDMLKTLKVITDVGFKSHVESIFTSHYLRYGLCEAIVNELGNMINQETNGRYSATIATDIIKGDILEAIVHLDLYKSNKYVFDKYRTADGWEVDLVIEEGAFVDVYEIKHSDKVVDEQAKNLLNYDFMQVVEQNYNKPVRNKTILYRGMPTERQMTPADVFDGIIKDKKQIGKPTLRWQEIKDRAILQNWQSQLIKYENVESFLSDI